MSLSIVQIYFLLIPQRGMKRNRISQMTCSGCCCLQDFLLSCNCSVSPIGKVPRNVTIKERQSIADLCNVMSNSIPATKLYRMIKNVYCRNIVVYEVIWVFVIISRGHFLVSSLLNSIRLFHKRH